MSAKINKIVLEISGKKIELSVEEAKELNGLLGELFNEKIKPIPYPYPHPVIPPIYPYRYWTVYTDNKTVKYTAGVSHVDVETA